MLAALFVLAQAETPYVLNIGRPGQMKFAPGAIYSTETGQEATVSEIAAEAAKRGFLYLGEQHATAPHQQLQADLVKALVDVKQPTMVGVEMLTRPTQPGLTDFIAGKGDEASFLTAVDWKTTWGFDYKFYRPLFQTCRDNSVPMVALNVPRTWVRAVGRLGYAGLSPTERKDLPAELYLGNKQHRQVFDALMGGHTMPNGNENVYAAQVLWDEGMADTALKALQGQVPNTTTVIVAGAGHIMYGQGINYRITRRTGKRGVNVVMISSDKPVTCARGIADYVYVSEQPGQ